MTKKCYFIAHDLFLLWFPFPAPEKVPENKSNMLLGGWGWGGWWDDYSSADLVKFESLAQSSAELLLGSS